MKPRLSLQRLLLAAALLWVPAFAKTTDTDGDWSAQAVALKDTREAERVIRIGDIDNLGFGFAEAFNPFSGRSTDAHAYPFKPGETDTAPTDRILIGSGFTGKDIPNGQDGYSYDFSAENPLKNAPIKLPLDSLKDITIRDAVLCLMVDDFQSPKFSSKFQVTFNGVRFPEMETTINSLIQTGPIGKVIYIRLTQEMLETLKANELSILIDDPSTKAGDGFAYDFAKLMVNVKEFLHVGTIPGIVVDDTTGEPIAKANVTAAGLAKAETKTSGEFALSRVPAGLAIVEAHAAGYHSAQTSIDVIGGETSERIELRLKRSATVNFTGKDVRIGDTITLKKIQFDLNSAELRAEGRAELDRVADFLKQQRNAKIHLAGHTSSEGTAALNRDLSFRRVLSCKTYLASSGIDAARITTTGHGPDLPVAPNDTEENRALNRRVELKFTDL